MEHIMGAMAQRLYVVSVRLKDPTQTSIYGGHVMAADAKEAREKAEADFLRLKDHVPSGIHPNLVDIFEGTNDHRNELIKRHGYMVVARVSKAKDPSAWVVEEKSA